ncbi:MAG: hypothetical protein QG549_824 [Patescibacteria group bacterium]|nr:hypothetical protein [Patescibacteria group bacterium]
MTEVLSEQYEQRDGRPIGRFLLGLDGFAGQNDPLEYASRFSQLPDNFRKYRHKRVKVPGTNKDILIDGREVTLEFSIARTALIWTVNVAAEQHTIEDIAVNYQPHGGEIYELHCAAPQSNGRYIEYGLQRRALRQHEFYQPETLMILQGVVEQIIGDE